MAGKANLIIISRHSKDGAVATADSRKHCSSIATCSHGGVNGIAVLSDYAQHRHRLVNICFYRTVHGVNYLSLLPRAKSEAQGDLSLRSGLHAPLYSITIYVRQVTKLLNENCGSYRVTDLFDSVQCRKSVLLFLQLRIKLLIRNDQNK